MERLSSPIEEMADDYDVVVVGSGYGGAIAASRLSRSGLRVCVLERGSERQPGEYPNTERQMREATQISAPGRHIKSRTGLYDIRLNEDLNVVLGCGLGGTSLINANVALRPDQRVWADPAWPRELKADVRARLEDGYRLAEEMLRPEPYPDSFPRLRKLRALEASARELGDGARFYRPPINVTFRDGTNHVGVEQRACVLCGDCVSGCNHRAKNTLLMNYLPDARKHQAEIFTRAAVRAVEPAGEGWAVRYQALQTGKEPFSSPTRSLTADNVIIAAGALGSTEILLRSRQQGLSVSAQLGTRFSGNGDVLAFAYNAERHVDGIGSGKHSPRGRPPVGPCITGIIDLRGEEIPLEEGSVIEEGAIPGAMATLVRTMLTVASHLDGVQTRRGLRSGLRRARRELASWVRGPRRGAMRNTQTFLVMSHDKGDGRLRLEDDHLRVDWPGVGSEPIFQAVNRRLEAASAALAATYVRDPIWTKYLGLKLVTVHPLGGCPMGADASSGVVDHKSRVYSGSAGTASHRGLYVLDGAIVPRPLGVNPLLTICALAERSCSLIAEDLGRTIDYALP